MNITIKNLITGKYEEVELKDVGTVHEADGVIYFSGTPYVLSSAHVPPAQGGTYYVRRDGDNRNDGLADLPGGPPTFHGALLTVSGVLDAIQGIDLKGGTLTIQLPEIEK